MSLSFGVQVLKLSVCYISKIIILGQSIALASRFEKRKKKNIFQFHCTVFVYKNYQTYYIVLYSLTTFISPIFHFMPLSSIYISLQDNLKLIGWDKHILCYSLQQQAKKYSIFICNLWVLRIQHATEHMLQASWLTGIYIRWFVSHLNRFIGWAMAELRVVGWPQLKNNTRAHIGFLNTISLVFKLLLLLKQPLNLQMYLL